MRRTAAVLAVVAGAILAGCLGLPGEAQRDEWRAQRPPASQVGQGAAFHLTGTTWMVHGELELPILSGPMSLHPAPGANAPWVVFRDARLPGKAAGLLVLEGDDIMVSGGAFAGLRATAARGGTDLRLSLETVPNTARAGDISFPPNFSAAQQVYRTGARVDATTQSITVSGFDRAMFWRPDEVDFLDVVPTFSATGWVWPAGSSLAPGRHDQPLQVTTERFALGGDLRGIVETRSFGHIVDPSAVIGRVASLRLENDRVWSAQDIRLTQVLERAGLRIPAEIEVRAASPRVEVKQGETAWLAVSLREASYDGMAVLEDVQVSGAGAERVRLPLVIPEPIFGLWTDANRLGAGGPAWAQPFRQVSMTYSSAYVIEPVDEPCGVSECPPAYPFPAWIGAADVGIFYLRITGDGPRGAHDVILWLYGRNFELETMPFTVVIV